MGLGAEQLFGSFAGLFTDPDEINRIYKNEALNTGVNEQAGIVSGYSKDNQATVQNYLKALDRYRPNAQLYADQDAASLGTVIGQNLNYNPLDTYERIRSGNLAAFDEQAGRIADRGGLANRMALAARGYGGRGAGSYESILTNDRVAKGLAPALAAIFGGLGSDTGSITSGRNANFGQILAAINARQGVGQNLLGMEASPIGVRNLALASQGNALNSLADTTNRNFGGFQTIEDKWKTFAKGLGASTDAAVDTGMQVAQLAVQAYTGGKAGGVGASPGRSGDGNSQQQMQQIMQMLQQQQGGGSGQSQGVDLRDWYGGNYDGGNASFNSFNNGTGGWWNGGGFGTY